MSNIPLPGQIYRHFKGNLYRVVTLAEHSETGEMLVIYQALYGEYRIYARPLSMFMEKLDKKKYPESTSEFRFELQKEVIVPPAVNVPSEGQSRKETALEEPSVMDESSVEEQMPDLGKSDWRKQETEAFAGTETETPRENEAAGRARTETGEEEELHIDPLVLEFLDAGTYEERLNILAALHSRITHEMINTMAIALDVEIGEEEDTERRFEELCACLNTLKRYESSRLR